MRVLLDECIPRQLRRDLSGHDVRTVADMEWGGIKNGNLLRQAAAEFDVLLTTDRNMEFKALGGRALTIVHGRPSV